MDPIIIAAIITGTCAVVASGVAIIGSKKGRSGEDPSRIEIPPLTKHDRFLDSKDEDFSLEDFMVNLGGRLQRSRDPNDIYLRRIESKSERNIVK